ncbi:hypothetical protein LB504_001916 [Fusarium proliferatum]|nr:hypothetical protein LB504_001916 [Fusarium proliferatum]
MPRDWLKACICTILEIFHRKKRISSGFVAVFLLSQRETDTNISYSDFAQQGATLRTRGFNNILTSHTACVPRLFSTGSALFAFGSHLQTDTSNLSFCYGFTVLFTGGDGKWRSFLHGFCLGPARRR